jgi:hypothetical protein
MTAEHVLSAKGGCRWAAAVCWLVVVTGPQAACRSPETALGCLSDGILALGSPAASTLDVECELPTASWVVATRDTTQAAALEALGVPSETARMVEISSGCNWHVTPVAPHDTSGQTSERQRWLCERLPFQVSALFAVETRRFRATLARDSEGGAHLVRLAAIP